MTKEFTVEEIADIVLRFKSEETPAQIGKIYDCHYKTISSILNKEGFNTFNRKFNEAEVSDILDRFKNNETLRSISKTYKCHHKTISNIVNNNGYSTRERKVPFHHKRVRTMQSGYIRWYDPTSRWCNAHGDVYEHRHVMGEYLGRPFFDGENVHHKNGDRSDNRIDNLELWVTIQPVGQRPEDLVAFAKEILERYENANEN